MKSLPFLLIPFLLAGGSAWGVPFRDTLRQQNVTFAVNATDEGSIQLLQVKAHKGLHTYLPVKQELIGRVVGAEAKDLNRDGQPELVVIVQSAGSGRYGGVQAWTAGAGRSLLPITLPDLSANLAEGYRGYDTFQVLEGGLERSFPIHRAGDPLGEASGGKRVIFYTLAAGEGGWTFQPTRVTTVPAP